MDYQKEADKVVEWMRNYVKNSGAKGIVVGLSGGIDSSVIAWCAVQAIGKGKVIGVSIPCQTSFDMAYDATDLALNLGIQFREINIEPSYNAMIEALVEVDNITQANLKARLRMTTLYGISNKINYLVAGTGNLSELEIGYFTKFGDGGVDIEPLGNYYKTEVYKMAELMPEIPDSVKTKAPSADLWEGQTDEEEIGMSYEELDVILKALIDGDSIMLDAIDIEKVDKVQNMRRSAIHKNNTPPRLSREREFSVPTTQM